MSFWGCHRRIAAFGRCPGCLPGLLAQVLAGLFSSTTIRLFHRFELHKMRDTSEALGKWLFRITVANRDYNHLSQVEIGGGKRIYQDLFLRERADSVLFSDRYDLARLQLDGSEEIAECIGTCRESVTRTLSDLKRPHLVMPQRSTLLIADR